MNAGRPARRVEEGWPLEPYQAVSGTLHGQAHEHGTHAVEMRVPEKRGSELTTSTFYQTGFGNVKSVL
jgi:hypothetical protein